MNVRPPLRTFASATLFAALCFAQPFALAENGGTGKGTLTVEGEVTDSTCVVNFKDATAGTQAPSSSTLKLTAVKRADLNQLAEGAELTATPAKFTIVSLGNSTGAGCSLDNSNSFWDFEINAESTKTLGSKVLLSSVAADTGSSASRSNVLVQLKAKVIDAVNTVATPDTSGASDVTFAIVEVPKGEGAGVLGSAARINSSGFGVVPYLSPYYMNDVQISLEGSPTELEVDNANQKVAPVEGSIVRLKFNASSGRPLLIVLQASNGVRIPIGATVTDSQGNEVGTVGQGSRALVRVQTNKDQLKVVWGDKPDETCSVAYALDEKQTANASGFTNLKLKCEVADRAEKTAEASK